jgi:hypothetical protein
MPVAIVGGKTVATSTTATAYSTTASNETNYGNHAATTTTTTSDHLFKIQHCGNPIHYFFYEFSINSSTISLSSSTIPTISPSSYTSPPPTSPPFKLIISKDSADLLTMPKKKYTCLFIMFTSHTLLLSFLIKSKEIILQKCVYTNVCWRVLVIPHTLHLLLVHCFRNIGNSKCIKDLTSACV